MSIHANRNPLLSSFQDSYRELLRFLTRRTGNAEDARELAQDMWVRLAERPPADAEQPRAYLYAMAQNLALDHLRRRQRSHIHALDHVALHGNDEALDVADRQAHRQALDAVVRVLDALPARTRDAFLLHRLDGLGHDALALQYGVSRSTIERDVLRASDSVQAALMRWRGDATPTVAKRQPGRRRALGALLGIFGMAGTGALAWQGWRTYVPQWQASFATLAGRQLTRVLPDGSSLMLDAMSGVEVDYFADRRALRLLQGAAYFTVVADGRPFVVDTPGVRITVLGTQFSVERDGEAVDIGVISGRVRVEPLMHGPQASALELGRGEGLRVAPGQPVQRLTREPATLASWRKGWLGFSQTPLGDVARRLSPYLTQPLVVSPAASRLPVSGQISIAQVDEWLRVLPAALPVRVTQAGGRIEIDMQGR